MDLQREEGECGGGKIDSGEADDEEERGCRIPLEMVSKRLN